MYLAYFYPRYTILSPYSTALHQRRVLLNKGDIFVINEKRFLKVLVYGNPRDQYAVYRYEAHF